MWRGSVLFLLGCLSALAAAHCGNDGDHANELAFQLERLEARLGALKDRIDSSDDIDHAIDVVAKLEELEDSECGGDRFSCGDGLPCVSNLLACDGVNDCANGADETDVRCFNAVASGSRFSGRIEWDSCDANPAGEMTISITGNKIFSYFPSTVWLNAVTKFDYGSEEVAWRGSGAFDYGSAGFYVSNDNNGLEYNCVFVGNGAKDTVDCTITTAAGDTTCAVVRLNRQ